MGLPKYNNQRGLNFLTFPQKPCSLLGITFRKNVVIFTFLFISIGECLK